MMLAGKGSRLLFPDFNRLPGFLSSEPDSPNGPSRWLDIWWQFGQTGIDRATGRSRQSYTEMP